MSVTTFISPEGLLKLVKKQSLVDKWYSVLVEQLAKAGINTKSRFTAFLAQILHESGNLSAVKENLNYTALQLLKTWPLKFKSLEFAKTFEKQPEKIANFVYGGRMGNNFTGDGWKYIGRGLIGITGKENYANLSKDTGIDFVTNPSLLEVPKNAIIASLWFWNKYKLSDTADKIGKPYDPKLFNSQKDQDLFYYRKITQRINGGQIGAADRENKFNSLVDLTKKKIVANKKKFSWFFFSLAAVTSLLIYLKYKKT